MRPGPSLSGVKAFAIYLMTAAIALATVSILRLLSAATQMRPLDTA